MSTAPHSAAQPQRRPRFTPDKQQIEQYFAALPPSADGCREIAIGNVRRDNPAKIDIYPPRPAWNEGHRFRWDSTDTRAQLIEGIAHNIRRSGNVYSSRAVYQSPERKADAAQPSRVLVFDDVTPDPIYSMLVATSPNNYQGYIFTDEDMDPTTVRELSERGAKALAGTKNGHADSCYDVSRLVRIPGSYNTKNGTAFQVRIASHTGATYSIAQLRARWPEVEHNTAAPTDFTWSEVEHCLANIDGITKRIGQHTKTYEQLHGDGGDDRSDLRWGLACNLRNKFGYPDEEIAAILWRFNWGHLREKGTVWLKGDIEDCIAGANRLYPDVETKPSYCRLSWQAKPAQPLPHVERPKTGRRRCLTDEQYLDWLHHEDNRLHSQSKAAHTLGVSTPTIRRIEKRLTAAGMIKRKTVPKRAGTYSYVVLISSIKTPEKVDIKDNQDASLARSPNSERAQQHAENCESPPVVGVTHPPDRATAAPQPSPSEAVAWAFTVLRAEDRIVTLKRVKDWIAEHVPGVDWSERRIKSAYNVHRKQEQREYSAGYWEGLRSMRVDELQQAIESIDKRLHKPPKRPRLTPAQLRTRRQHLRMVLDQKLADAKRATAPSGGVWGYKSQIVEEEIERRQKAGEWPPERRRRTRRAAMPDMPLVLFEPDLAPPAEGEALSGGCVSPPQPQSLKEPGHRQGLRLSTLQDVQPRVNPDQVCFLLDQLPKRGPMWAWEHIARVGGESAWPQRVIDAVLAAEVAGGEV